MNAARKNALLTVVLAFVAMFALLAGCSSGSLSAETTVTSTAGGTESDSSAESVSSGSSPSTTASPSTTKVVPPVASIAATPALGSVDLSPVEPISFTVDKGTIDDVTLTNPEGKVVVATIAPDKKSWSVGEVLGFGKTYTLAGTATGTDGKQISITGTYTTVSTDTQTRNTVNPADGAVVGVAAPVTVSFGVEPEDRALIEKNVSITTTPAVEGAWAWVKHDDGRWAMDYRPKEYWPAGTAVHVEAKLYGLRLNASSYGASDLTSDFTIGRNQVVVADVNSHDLVVQQNGQTVASYPASFGRGSDNGDPELVTRSGVHVVTEKAEEYLMNNPRYGYTNSLQRWTVRISNNGEFIHANPDSAGAQGNSNVTHGCVNLSTADAQAYYNSAIWGDPVEVSGTDVNLSSMDGDIYIWGMSWDEWKAMSTTP
jgi:lipoprotein-anchoring transpeptidase ErfK/SrfK